MKFKTDRAAVPYSYLIDNLKVLLIFLVVFNHIIAFNLVKVDIVVRYIWYAITISTCLRLFLFRDTFPRNPRMYSRM